MPHGLVVEHRAKRRPARIQDRLRHLGAGQSRAVHITHTDQGVFPDDAGGLFVQEVAPLGSDLPVYPARQRLAPGSLRARQFGRRFAEVTRVLDLLPGGEPGQRTEAEVNADFAVPRRKGIRDLADKVQIPAPGRVLAETARSDVGRDRAREPEPVLWPRKVTVSPSILSGRSHWNGTHPRNRFGPRLTRQRGFRFALSRLLANCLHTACTVSLCSPSSLLLPLVSLIRSKPDGQRRLSLRLSFRQGLRDHGLRPAGL
jgi:hypothetical protein